jgi:hypothetical protein
MAKGDNRAVVGSSGRPLKGMVLESGVKTVAAKLGKYSTQKDVRTKGDGHFNVSDCTDQSIGAPQDGSEWREK